MSTAGASLQQSAAGNQPHQTTGLWRLLNQRIQVRVLRYANLERNLTAKDKKMAKYLRFLRSCIELVSSLKCGSSMLPDLQKIVIQRYFMICAPFIQRLEGRHDVRNSKATPPSQDLLDAEKNHQPGNAADCASIATSEMKRGDFPIMHNCTGQQWWVVQLDEDLTDAPLCWHCRVWFLDNEVYSDEKGGYVPVSTTWPRNENINSRRKDTPWQCAESEMCANMERLRAETEAQRKKMHQQTSPLRSHCIIRSLLMSAPYWHPSLGIIAWNIMLRV